MGLEAYYDTELAGVNGRKYGYLGDSYELESVKKQAIDGYNIVTTIDQRLQKICEDKIAKWQKETHSGYGWRWSKRCFSS